MRAGKLAAALSAMLRPGVLLRQLAIVAAAEALDGNPSAAQQPRPAPQPQPTKRTLRRAASTLRPPGVAMRARKPLTRARFLQADRE